MTGRGCRGCGCTAPSARRANAPGRRPGRFTSRTAAASPGVPSAASARAHSRRTSPRRARRRSSTTTSSRRSRNMSAALDRLKQQNGPVQSPQPLGSPETMELLTSILAAVEAQNTRIATLTEQQKKLAGFVKVDSEEQEKQLSAISHQLTSTSPPPESNENSELLAGIASTLAGMSVNLNGESLKGSASKSEAAAKHLD